MIVLVLSGMAGIGLGVAQGSAIVIGLGIVVTVFGVIAVATQRRARRRAYWIHVRDHDPLGRMGRASRRH